MINCYETVAGRIKPVDTTEGEPTAEALRAATWIDLLDPSEEEDRLVMTSIGVDIPSRAEMEEIETSSRLYIEDGTVFMTALVPADADSDSPRILPVSFVLGQGKLVTVRYHQPKSFDAHITRAIRTNTGCVDPVSTLARLLDAVVDRIADILERVGREVDIISKDVFQQASEPVREHDYQSILQRIGRKGEMVSLMRDSLATLDRLFIFFGNAVALTKVDKETKAAIKTLSRDAHSLTDHATFLSQKITFLLDATLGLINIEQSGIIKIFSVVAVIFLPPTLVASIYGMNFRFMPELDWTLGYPFALGLMVVSAILPYLFFKRKGWL